MLPVFTGGIHVPQAHTPVVWVCGGVATTENITKKRVKGGPLDFGGITSGGVLSSVALGVFGSAVLSLEILSPGVFFCGGGWYLLWSTVIRYTI